MTLLLLAMAALLLGAVVPLLLSGSRRNDVSVAAAISVVVASVLGLIPAIQVLAGGETLQFRYPWPVPYGEFSIQLDALSAWFLVPTLLLSALCAIYGIGYMRTQSENVRWDRSVFFTACWCWA